MNREGKKCVLYPRVSTEMQVDGYSLEGQKNGLKRFADREEMEIVGIYEDAGKSGKSIEGRPAFKKMLSDIKNGLEIDYILVYKLSRFGRNAADILNSLEFVQSYGINLICIEEGIDSSQTSGKLLISVLSAVAEIERENIIEQTMNGRREKARQGGWNGGFAPYGYYLKDNQLLIEETEAEAIRIIFDKFANSDIGLGGVAKYLNLQGIKKIPRQNGTLETWSSHFIRLILDNPVYCGKIAYGRRTREKVKGTKNEYKQVHAEDYILEDGQHEGIISEELWQKVHAKRMATGIKQPSKIGKDRSHLLTGILKCPLCGSSMYTNKHAWTNKDGTYKEVYYYICGRNKQERGHHCDYKASLRKTDIEPLVIEAVKELVSDKYFAKEIEKRIGVQTDTTAIDKELANYESKLKEVDLNKARLEREIDNLPIDARFRERKIHDMTLRLDALYDTIVELEERIEDAKLRKSSIEMETITLDNIYKLMLNFGKLYDIISDEEKKSLITYLIKEIQIYPNGESEQPLKSIEFNFPIYRDGQEVRRLLWEKGNTVDIVPSLHTARLDGQLLLEQLCRSIQTGQTADTISGCGNTAADERVIDVNRAVRVVIADQTADIVPADNDTCHTPVGDCVVLVAEGDRAAVVAGQTARIAADSSPIRYTPVDRIIGVRNIACTVYDSRLVLICTANTADIRIVSRSDTCVDAVFDRRTAFILTDNTADIRIADDIACINSCSGAVFTEQCRLRIRLIQRTDDAADILAAKNVAVCLGLAVIQHTLLAVADNAADISAAQLVSILLLIGVAVRISGTAPAFRKRRIMRVADNAADIMSCQRMIICGCAAENQTLILAVSHIFSRGLILAGKIACNAANRAIARYSGAVGQGLDCGTVCCQAARNTADTARSIAGRQRTGHGTRCRQLDY